MSHKYSEISETSSSGGGRGHRREKLIVNKGKYSSIRMMDEECWLSGSELKTDNSSSSEDEEMIQIGKWQLFQLRYN